MSSALTLLILGNAYFHGGTSLTAPNQVSVVNRPEPVPQIAPVKRGDYTYTPGIGAHKVHNIAVKWHKAKLTCEDEGGHLLIVNSKAESDVIVELLAIAKPHVASVDSDYVYVGFHDFNVEGQYETVDGKPLSESGYIKWLPGEPNNGGNIEDCGSMYRDGSINDDSCAKKYGFVCELPETA